MVWIIIKWLDDENLLCGFFFIAEKFFFLCGALNSRLKTVLIYMVMKTST